MLITKTELVLILPTINIQDLTGVAAFVDNYV